MKRFRLLKPDEIECRVQKIVPEKGVSILLYKTARTDADLLDETVGCDKWENDFKVVDGTLYGGIGVDYGNGMVWKWDAGTESNTEKEKGRASDAYKRAGFKHGIGRELYSSPFIWIAADKCRIEKTNKGNFICKTAFDVCEIEYDENEKVSQLVLTGDGKEVFRYGGNAAPSAPPKKTENSNNDMKFRCEECGEILKPYTTDDGVEINVRRHANGSKKKYGRVLCLSCIETLKAQEEQVTADENTD